MVLSLKFIEICFRVFTVLFKLGYQGKYVQVGRFTSLSYKYKKKLNTKNYIDLFPLWYLTKKKNIYIYIYIYTKNEK